MYYAYEGQKIIKIRSVSKGTWSAFIAGKDGSMEDVKIVSAKTKIGLIEKLTIVDFIPGVDKKIKRVAQSKLTRKRKPGIGKLTLKLIRANKEDDEIFKAVKERFPNSKFKLESVSHYRSTLFRDSIIEAKHAPRKSLVYINWKNAQRYFNPTKRK